MKNLILIIALTLIYNNNAQSDIGSDGTELHSKICFYIGSDGTELDVGSDGTELKVGSDGTELKVGSDGTELNVGSDGTEIYSDGINTYICHIIKS